MLVGSVLVENVNSFEPMVTPGGHRFKRGSGELFVVGHLKELRRGEELSDSSRYLVFGPRLTQLIVKLAAPAGAADQTSEISS